MKPDESWVVVTTVHITEKELSTYGNIRLIALPKALNALGRCNDNMYNIYLWMKEHKEDK